MKMSMKHWMCVGWLSGWMSLPAAAQEERGNGSPPATQERLNTWWSAAAQMTLDETAYVIGDVPITFADGSCRYSLNEGILIPVRSGRAPVSERIVGMVFVGKGDLNLHFSQRADAWRFANHMVNNAKVDLEQITPVLRGGPFHTTVDRGMVLSADPAIIQMLYDLAPVRAGVRISEGEDGIDEVYVVTDNRGGLVERLVGVNLLNDRLRRLELSGLPAEATIRQDRLLHEELGFPGDQLRLIADFRTETPFRVATIDGNVIGPNVYDRWLTCYRDGQDLAGTGVQSMAFAHGLDNQKRRHFMQFTGEPTHSASDYGDLEPPLRFAPVEAHNHIEIRPVKRGLEQRGEVHSTITLRAVGGPLQHVALRMPTGTAIPRSWTLNTLRVQDGPSLPWVGLTVGLGRNDSLNANMRLFSNDLNPSAPGETIANNAADNSLEQSLPGSLAPSASLEINANDAFSPAADDPSSNWDAPGFSSAPAQAAYVRQQVRYEIIALLPEPIPEGETITLDVHWQARWEFGGLVASTLNSAGELVPAGNTTGPQPLLPDILPAPGGTIWNHETVLGTPTPHLRSLRAVVSGETEARWVDDGDGWSWVRTRGDGERNPSFALGQWSTYAEPPSKGAPGVQVSTFPRNSDLGPGLVPQVRAVVDFLERFLPDFQDEEIEVYQMTSQAPYQALLGAPELSRPGLVEIIRTRGGSMAVAGAIQREFPYRGPMMVARQLAGQYWGQRITPASSRDTWMIRALSEAYASFFVRAAYGFRAYADTMTELRGDLEKTFELNATRSQQTLDWRKSQAGRVALTLTTPTWLSDVPQRVRDAYGTYVLTEMLRNRLGDPVFLGALDRLATERAGKRVSTEMLQSTFEEHAGRDLSDFFDYWVHGGFLPEVTVIIPETIEEGWLHGCIETDIPYGTIDVPIRIVDQDGARTNEALVDVKEGNGHFQLNGLQGEITVELDPYRMVLARKRQVKRVDTLPCAAVFASDATPLQSDDAPTTRIAHTPQMTR